MQAPSVSAPRRRDDRVVIHFDYDAFYCAVVEADNPQLKLLPLAVQRKSPPVHTAPSPPLIAPRLPAEKQIVVTCNYEARRRGLHKLQLIKDAKRLCPDLVIVLGEDLTRFRNASKLLYRFLRQYSWNGRVERLGFDEIWLDVTDQVDYNLNLLNPHDLKNAFFCLSKDDPTHGFAFDATRFAGKTFPASSELSNDISQDPLRLRLLVGSHLAQYLRAELEHQRNYTATVGVSTNKLLSKLVGNVEKPDGQTTLLPPYARTAIDFIDAHDIGKIPGIGFKLAQKLRASVLQRPAAFSDGLVDGGTEEAVTAGDVRKHVGVSAESLERTLGGPGSPHGIGARVWGLLHGVDDSEVGQARDVPKQISIEDSYIRLDTLDEVTKELKMLALSLVRRMRLDLLEDGERDEEAERDSRLGLEICAPTSPLLNAEEITTTAARVRTPAHQPVRQRWIAHPRTLRLSTRPRSPVDPATNTRPRTFARISRSAPLPNFIFSLTTPFDSLAERLVNEALLPLFRRLHPEKSGWNLSLVNVAVTNMADSAGDAKTSSGRDIGHMFKKQNEVLNQWRAAGGRVTPDPGHGVVAGDADSGGDGDLPDLAASHELATQHSFLSSHSPDPKYAEDKYAAVDARHTGSEDLLVPGVSSQDSRATLGDGGVELGWVDEAEEDGVRDGTETHSVCAICEALMPTFAMSAHARFHALQE
ncbi:DNA-repair protein [Macrophomina phaseolina MS6]|uniref:DNA-repair protein n=1 Tax=Macrophomina phaseolina (strain MS6) TaxID=1126212 RepID=K2SGW8_MACPH|nr:DNA-repair protein [Macrophomina phaseolina MS6]